MDIWCFDIEDVLETIKKTAFSGVNNPEFSIEMQKFYFEILCLSNRLNLIHHVLRHGNEKYYLR